MNEQENKECNCLKDVKDLLDKILESVLKTEEVFESKEVNELFSSLAKAHMEIEVAKSNNVNPFYKSKYADLATIIKASRPYLAKNGLAVIQRILVKNGKLYLYSRLCHQSGQWIESKMIINPPEWKIQSVGSYVTYLKRYTYSALVGVVSSAEDDDGEAAMKKSREKEEKKKVEEKITRNELDILSNLLKDDNERFKNILTFYKIDKLSDLPRNKFNKIYQHLIKKENENE